MGWFIGIAAVLVIVLGYLHRRRSNALPWASRRERARYDRADQPGYNTLPPDGMSLGG
ncbi:hypothetical protein [Actinopolymorpha alba]|uniref:hypothetical protein n=1 Tax=Actinopolymorpha alba TaxID=533267 RepID=UPI00038094A6|nr:hypothetical protein [Actinopolymorpha alba]